MTMENKDDTPKIDEDTIADFLTNRVQDKIEKNIFNIIIDTVVKAFDTENEDDEEEFF